MHTTSSSLLQVHPEAQAGLASEGTPAVDPNETKPAYLLRRLLKPNLSPRRRKKS